MSGSGVSERALEDGVAFFQETLSSGLKIATQFVPAANKSYLGLFIKGGASSERGMDVPEGAAHMLEHVLINKIGQKNVQEYGMNGYTTESYVSLIGKVTKENQKQFARVLLDSIGTPTHKSMLAYEKPRVLAEYRHIRNTLSFYLEKTYAWLCTRPFSGALITGTPATIRKISHADISRISSKLIASNNVFLVGMGNVAHHEVVEASKHFVFPKTGTEDLKNADGDGGADTNTNTDTESGKGKELGLGVEVGLEVEAESMSLGQKQERAEARAQTHTLPYTITAYRTPGIGTKAHLLIWGLHSFVHFCLSSLITMDLQLEYISGLVHGALMLVSPNNARAASLQEVFHKIRRWHPEYVEYLLSVKSTAEPSCMADLRQFAQSIMFSTPYIPKHQRAAVLSAIPLEEMQSLVEEINNPVIFRTDRYLAE
ncbi:hypothetical protein NECID01_0128 [Nematocida sp. AWRm77]|nr:hypothetical protein NECID01_0128 [Nematocida sp. AWRm77]